MNSKENSTGLPNGAMPGLNRRAALIGAVSSIFIPTTALVAIQPALSQQPAMTAKERADFHFEEFARAMSELTPRQAHAWHVHAYGFGSGEFVKKAGLTYRVPDPEIAARLKRPFFVDKMVDLGDGE